MMAPPARLELTTLRLGGVRSIQVSYGGIHKHYTRKCKYCQPIPGIFSGSAHILFGNEFLRGGSSMRECDDRDVDLDDLIFDPEDYHESQR